ncbi:MAG: class II aldolase/adducin family protein [Phycisphaerae bacterium]
MCEIGRRAYAHHLVGATEGNFSARLDDGRVLCTPTGLSKGLLTPDDLCLLDPAGRQIDGRRRPSSEIPMHLAVYRAAPAVRAVIHTHPPYATAFAVAGDTDLANVLPEGDIFLGPVPLVPYQTPGTPEMGEALLPFLADHVAALLQNHGALTWAGDLEAAYILTETLEALCRAVFLARQIGHVRRIPDNLRPPLATLRAALRGGAG